MQPYEANAAGDYRLAESLAREAMAAGEGFEGLMELAVAQFLQGDTQSANYTLGRAKKTNPDHFSNLAEQVAPLVAELASAMASKQVIRGIDSDHYDDKHVKVYWRSALREFIDASTVPRAGALVYAIMSGDIGSFIRETTPDGVFDFGCACGYPLHQFALRHPEIEFGGVDRQTVLKELNDSHFRAPNLIFFDGNVLDALQKFQPDRRRKLLMHVRTGIMVFPAFLEQLYRQADAAGFTSVALYEIASLGGQSQLFRDQGSGFATEVHRSTMFLHDYATALARAGFRQQSIVRKPHGHSLPKNNMLPGDTYIYIEASKPAPLARAS